MSHNEMPKDTVEELVSSLMVDRNYFEGRGMRKDEEKLRAALTTAYNKGVEVERIEIEQRLKRSWDKSIDEGTVWDLGNALEALTPLTRR